MVGQLNSTNCTVIIRHLFWSLNSWPSNSNPRTSSVSMDSYRCNCNASNDYARTLLTILIPVMIILSLFLIFLLVLLINPKFALCIRTKDIERKRKKGLFGLILQNHGHGGRMSRPPVSNNYTLDNTTHGLSFRPRQNSAPSSTNGSPSTVNNLTGITTTGERVLSYHPPAPRNSVPQTGATVNEGSETTRIV